MLMCGRMRLLTGSRGEKTTMLWFNNHSHDQERYYMEAREFMREQRRQQSAMRNTSDGDGTAELFGVLGCIVFFGCLLTTANLGLSFGLLVVVFVVLLIVEYNKVDSNEKMSKSSQSRSGSYKKKEDYTDDSF